ncbi:hypothetical protein CBR_g52045 [Chara braunii]|uniref:DNA polymerase V n=1 Tax=Chara braunii TaxID=69332 RepID=A0A388M9A2_CHABU|nr:hypothetical protein CBR_g52045 [Chara braunii]|eukprot:GBG91164.1 hypothetical protein CBR_g52045 [Chara braunii]
MGKQKGGAATQTQQKESAFRSTTSDRRGRDEEKMMTATGKGVVAGKGGVFQQPMVAARSPSSPQHVVKKGLQVPGNKGTAAAAAVRGALGAAVELAERGAVQVVDVESMKGLQIYWNLASIDDRVRQVATEALVKEIKEGQEAFERGGNDGNVSVGALLGGGDEVKELLKDCSPGLQYALRRLIRGMASSRQGARQGFSLALSRLMAEVECISGHVVLKLIDKALAITGSMKGIEARDNYNGRVFAFGAIVRSERLIGDGTEDGQADLAREVVDQVLQIATRKVFLREAAVQIVLDLASRLPSESLQRCIFSASTFTEWLTMDAEQAFPEAVRLACEMWEHLPASMIKDTPLLPDSGERSGFFKPSHLSVLVPALKASTHCHPRVHTVWRPIIDLLFSVSRTGVPMQASDVGKKKKDKKKKRKKDAEGPGDGEARATDGDGDPPLASSSATEAQLDEEVSSFWNVVVEGGLVTSSHERRALALQLLLLLLPRLRSSHLSIVLSRGIMQCLSDSLLSKDRTLHLSAKRWLQELVEWGEKEGEKSGIRVAVLAALQQQHGRGGFDKVLKDGGILRRLSDSLGKDESKQYLSFLKEQFHRPSPDPSRLENNADEEREEEQQKQEKRRMMAQREEDQMIWMIDQMCTVCKSRQLDILAKRELSLDVLKFLVVHAFFRVRKPVKGEKVCMPEIKSFWNDDLPKGVREVCATKLVGLVTAVRNLREPWGVRHSTANCQDGGAKNTSEERKDGRSGETVETEQGKSSKGSVEEKDNGQRSGSDAILFELIEWVEKIESLPVVTPVHQGSDDDQVVGRMIGSAVGMMKGQLKSSRGLDRSSREACMRLRSMCALLVLLRLQVMIEPGTLSETVRELLICCKKAFPDVLTELDVQGGEAEGEKDEPAFMDVLVDILLSLLAKPSAGVRDAAEKVFQSFSGMLTETGLQDMLRVLRRPVGDSRPVHLAGVQSDDDEEDEDVSESSDGDGEDHDEDESQDANGERKSEGSETDDDDDDSNDGNGEGDDEEEEDHLPKKRTLGGKKRGREEEQQQLGKEDKAGKSSGDESSDLEEGDDLDDEAMFRVDEKLAAMFKLRKEALGGGNAKESKLEQLRFKCRVLSLIERFLKNNSGSPFVVSMVWPLLKAMANAAVIEEGAEFTGKLGSVLKAGVCKGREIPKGDGVDITAVRHLHKRCVLMAFQSRHPLIGSAAEACSRWALRVLHANIENLALDGDATLAEVYVTALDRYFLKKTSRANLDAFLNVIRTYDWLGRGIISRVIVYCEKGKTEFCQVTALKLLLDILRVKGNAAHHGHPPPHKEGKGGTKDTAASPVPRTLAAATSPHIPEVGRLIHAMIKKKKKCQKSSWYADVLKVCKSLLEALTQVLSDVPGWARDLDLARLIRALEKKEDGDAFTPKVRAAEEALWTVCQSLSKESSTGDDSGKSREGGQLKKEKEKKKKKEKEGKGKSSLKLASATSDATTNGSADGVSTGDEHVGHGDTEEEEGLAEQKGKASNGEDCPSSSKKKKKKKAGHNEVTKEEAVGKKKDRSLKARKVA